MMVHDVSCRFKKNKCYKYTHTHSFLQWFRDSVVKCKVDS
jgi:hypothetical protein